MEIMEPLMDCNFPELLAKDLCQSQEVFLAKNLTAGAPRASLADDGSKRRYSLQDGSTQYLQTRNVLSQMKSLRIADEKYSEAFFKNYEFPRKSMESNATDNSDWSAGMEQSVRTHNVSVTTAATSVTSGRESSMSVWKTLSKPSSPTGKMPKHSWMDLDVDDSANMDRAYSMSHINSPPRPLSRQKDVGNLRSMSMTSKFSDPFASFNSPTESIHLTFSPSKSKFPHAAIQAAQIPQRRSSLKHQNQPRLMSLHESPLPTSHTSRYFSGSTVDSENVDKASSEDTVAPAFQRAQSTNGAPARRDDETSTDTSSDAELTSNLDDDSEELPEEETATTSSVSPMVQIEKWLESSFDAATMLPNAENGPSVVPLSPDVMDSLRISVTCFPETMLLCSSLSIETIRGNVRRVRYRSPPNPDSESEIAEALSSGSPTKPSMWKWLTAKRPSEQVPTKLQTRQRIYQDTSSTSSTPDWSAFRNVFPSGTEHMFDALYAHILAYNYITALCPRTAPVSIGARPMSKSSTAPSLKTMLTVKSKVEDGIKIPRKAASLLGMQNDPASIVIPEAPHGGSLRNKSSFLQANKPLIHSPTSISFAAAKQSTSAAPKAFTSATGRSVDEIESLRRLRLGLARCIARLVATLRLASMESTRIIETNEVDPLLIRALCEIVRCCEERS